MIRNYIMTTVRNILRSKGYSFITVFSLAMGIAAFIMISLWINTELSYDKFHEDSDDIYQVLGQGTKFKNFPSLPEPLAPFLQRDIPEITYATRYYAKQETLVKFKTLAFYEKGLVTADPAFFSIFGFKFIRGDKNTALPGPDSMVITRKFAKKYFGRVNPIGKTLTLNNQYDFNITGIIEDIAFNSSLQFDMVIPFKNITSTRVLSWDNFSPKIFIKIHQGASVRDVNKKIANFVAIHQADSNLNLSLLSFAERHLFFSGVKKYIYIFIAIGILILIIASVNFINLSTVRSINRAREIGIRKITGASKKNIIFQFLGESLSLAFIAIFLVFLSLFPLIRIFTNLTGKEILIDSLFLGLMIVFLAFITGIIAGIYPAFVISSFQPTSVLKGRIKGGSRGHLLRKTLLIFQFAISVILIIGARGIFNQLDYMKNMDIGYQKEQVILLPLKGKTSRYFQAFKNQLIQEPGIQGISGSIAGLPYFGWSTGGIDWEGKDSNQRVFVTFNYVDYDFLKTLRIDIKQGRGFSREYPNDKKNYIINEEMARRMGLQSPEEKTLSLWKKPGAVIGVVKDFNYEPLDKKIEPLVLMLRPEKIEFALIRIRPGDISATLKIIKRTWVKIIPSYPFKYQFLDREFNHKYINVERIGKLVKIFSFLAILIACLGLFGLASSDTENRKKEVGIRKTLGAANWKIIFLFTRDFIKWVLVAIIIALPAAWYLINKWLQNFAYHITLSPWFFIAAGVIVFGIALATVCLKTIRAANANPIEALRYE